MLSFSLTLLLASVIAISQATPLRLRSRQRGIQWQQCPDEKDSPLQCANLTVPLDYSGELSNATVPLELFRVPAPNNRSNGSVLLNFGGPGANGRLSLFSYKEILQGITGGNHDLIAVVPRGTGNNTLRFSCYNTELERMTSDLVYDLPNGLSSDTAVGKLWVHSKFKADACYATQNKTGSFVSTASTARDFMSVVDALDEDGMLRYWGISYGTVLGSTLAAMYPDRIDKMVLDAVVNLHEYYQNKEREMFSDADNVFRGFCSGCVDSPETCPLGRNTTAAELEASIYSMIEKIKYNPYSVTVPVLGPTIIDYTTVRTRIISDLYSPVLWPSTASFLNGLLTGNGSAVAEYLASVSVRPSGMEAEAQFGVKCSDAFATMSSAEELAITIQTRQQSSRIGGDTADYVPMVCAHWKLAAKERYDGDFRVKTKTPVLFIGNTHDPVTPLVSARNVSSGFEGSVLLQHDGYGHGSLELASLCTAKATRAYFRNGTLPEANTKCDTTGSLFSGETGWDEVLEELGKK
ncbi:proteinase [Aspergillus steynii IBT 23096]|uniref:Proteinase n=1 Tax=Aspergillus steynii IBT 23096 TaxID=1392250 RepID=A0A2I2GMS7_9EURO|nr:proteinase [Aspergillus steynii IBT 23096]PLB54183.1 proteinase [Aspergillus steynii IBT 23096]